MKSIILLLVFIFLASGKSESPMDRIEKLWNERETQAAFDEVSKAIKDNEHVKSNILTEMTGVRRIVKLVEAKGDETAYYIDDIYVILASFTPKIRIFENKHRTIYEVPGTAFPIGDTVGLFCYKSRWIFYFRPERDKYVLYQFDMDKHFAKPLGILPGRNCGFRFDESDSLLQVTGQDNKILDTYNLVDGTRIEHDKLLYERTIIRDRVKVQYGSDTITFSFNEKKIEMAYPRREYLSGNHSDEIVLTGKRNAFLYKSNWFPGLYILFDFEKGRAEKVFLPVWLDPSVSNISWELYGNYLYIFSSYNEKNGLYLISFKHIPSPSEFLDILVDFKLTRKDSSIGSSQSA